MIRTVAITLISRFGSLGCLSGERGEQFRLGLASSSVVGTGDAANEPGLAATGLKDASNWGTIREHSRA